MTAMFGQATQERMFVDALASGRVPHAWLLAGPPGVGKAGFAARAALFLVADGDRRAQHGVGNLDVDAADPAAKLVGGGTHPEYLVITRDVPEARRTKTDGDDSVARNITIGQVRQMLSRLRTRPAIARWRAIIIDSIDDMERGAANALLKILEEPPENTVFFLISHMPGRLLPTIRSRCRAVRFSPLSDEAVATILSARLPDTQGMEITALVRLARGSPGRALEYAALDLGKLDNMLSEILRDGDDDNTRRIALAKTVAGVSERLRLTALLLLASDQAQREALSHGELPTVASALTLVARVKDVARYAVAGSEDGMTVGFAIGSAFADYYRTARVAA